MGSDKAFLPFRGKAMFEYSLEVLTVLCSEIFISSGSSAFERIAGVRVVPDEIKNSGPMGGMLSCLRLSDFEHALVLGCDMPFITAGYFRFLMAHLRSGESVVGRRSDGYLEPLAGVYSKALVPELERLIKEGDLKMAQLTGIYGVRVIDLKNTEFDDPRLFSNINSLNDIENS
jgi:molybdopterin-guanine dinucleotide biosynthesis protein A